LPNRREAAGQFPLPDRVFHDQEWQACPFLTPKRISVITPFIRYDLQFHSMTFPKRTLGVNWPTKQCAVRDDWIHTLTDVKGMDESVQEALLPITVRRCEAKIILKEVRYDGEQADKRPRLRRDTVVKRLRNDAETWTKWRKMIQEQSVMAKIERPNDEKAVVLCLLSFCIFPRSIGYLGGKLWQMREDRLFVTKPQKINRFPPGDAQSNRPVVWIDIGYRYRGQIPSVVCPFALRLILLKWKR
jgi:hypothetical protein